MELNDEIRAKISNAASMDEVVRICAEAGIPVTKEQLEASDTTGAEGELSEEALDAVSGGGAGGEAGNGAHPLPRRRAAREGMTRRRRSFRRRAETPSAPRGA